MRAFVAIDLGPPSAPGDPNGPSRSPTHLTLRFLGDVAEDRIPAIAAALSPAVAPLPPFDLTIEGVGAFPSRTSPRVVWVGVTEGRDALVRLAQSVASALAGVGFPPEPGEFVPHVTLFRVRSARDRDRARGLLDGTVPPPGPRSVPVREVHLKESVLTRAGPVHRTLRSFPLARPVAGGS